MLPPEDKSGDDKPAKGDITGKGSSDDPENPTSGASAVGDGSAAAAADATFDEKEAAAKRDFLRNMYFVLCAQWSATTIALLLLTYWTTLRRFAQHYVQGLEMILIVPSLVSSVVLLMAFKTDPTKNLYVFGAFSGAFVASISVACTYMTDDHWLVLGFLIVTVYIHVFAFAQVPSAWKAVVNAALPNLAYSFGSAVAVSAAVTAFLTACVCGAFGWWHWIGPAGAFSVAVIVYGQLDTYYLLRNLAPDEWLIGLICLYTDPFNVLLSLFAMAFNAGAECASSSNKPAAANAFD